MGPATHMAMKVMSSVPTSSGTNPKAVWISPWSARSADCGFQSVPNRNWVIVGLPLMLGSKKKRHVSVTTEKMMPMVVRMATKAQAMSTTSTKRSNRLRARNSRSMRDRINAESAERQRHAGAEYRPGTGRCTRAVGVGRLLQGGSDRAHGLTGGDVADVAQGGAALQGVGR